MSLARLPWLRIARSGVTWGSVAGLFALVLSAALLSVHRGVVHAADHALDVYASIAAPLVVFAIVSAAQGGDGLAHSGRALVRLGAPPQRVALSTIVVAMLVSGVVSGILGAATIACAHASGDPPLVADALQTSAYGALGGGAYAAYFLFGSAFIGSFWGRGLLLVIDWLVGSDDGLGATFTPRAHLRNLLGGDAPFDFTASDSLMALVAIAILGATLAVWRVRRTRV